MKPKVGIPLAMGGIFSGAAVAIANANGWFVGHPYLFYIFAGGAVAMVAVAIVGAVIDSVRKPHKEKEAEPPRIHIENRLENIGNPVHDQSTRQSIVPPLPITRAQLHPELELFDCKPTVIFYGRTTWGEADLNDLNLKDFPPNACIAIFRKKPAPTGQEAVPAYDVTAHLTYRNEKGEQQIVNFGTWLGEYSHRIHFTRGESHSLVLSSAARAGKEGDGQVYVLDNPHEVNPFTGARFRSGMVIYAPDEKLMLRECNEVEIALISRNVTVYAGTLRRASKSGETVQFSVGS
jgi:hypothetical protein